MARAGREIITLQCTECKRRNYSTTKNKKTMTEKLELKKFCRHDRKQVTEGNKSPNACFCTLLRHLQANSSTGRAAVSKTAGWGFEPLLACQPSPAQLRTTRVES